jgi:uncharacterized protein YndB with AHSA1/START domain
MALETQAEIEIARSPEEVFDLATSCAGFPRFLLRFGPIPRVVRAELVGAAEPKPGGRRLIQMSDGSTMEEEILALDRPVRHRYRWATPPAPPFSLLVRSAEGDWTFTPTGGGTRIVWRYRFESPSRLAELAARPVIGLFRRWMSRGLANLRAILAP